MVFRKNPRDIKVKLIKLVTDNLGNRDGLTSDFLLGHFDFVSAECPVVFVFLLLVAELGNPCVLLVFAESSRASTAGNAARIHGSLALNTLERSGFVVLAGVSLFVTEGTEALFWGIEAGVTDEGLGVIVVKESVLVKLGGGFPSAIDTLDGLLAVKDDVLGAGNWSISENALNGTGGTVLVVPVLVSVLINWGTDHVVLGTDLVLGISLDFVLTTLLLAVDGHFTPLTVLAGERLLLRSIERDGIESSSALEDCLDSVDTFKVAIIGGLDTGDFLTIFDNERTTARERADWDFTGVTNTIEAAPFVFLAVSISVAKDVSVTDTFVIIHDGLASSSSQGDSIWALVTDEELALLVAVDVDGGKAIRSGALTGVRDLVTILVNTKVHVVLVDISFWINIDLTIGTIVGLLSQPVTLNGASWVVPVWALVDGSVSRVLVLLGSVLDTGVEVLVDSRVGLGVNGNITLALQVSSEDIILHGVSLCISTGDDWGGALLCGDAGGGLSIEGAASMGDASLDSLEVIGSLSVLLAPPVLVGFTGVAGLYISRVAAAVVLNASGGALGQVVVSAP